MRKKLEILLLAVSGVLGIPMLVVQLICAVTGWIMDPTIASWDSLFLTGWIIVSVCLVLWLDIHFIPRRETVWGKSLTVAGLTLLLLFCGFCAALTAFGITDMDTHILRAPDGREIVICNESWLIQEWWYPCRRVGGIFLERFPKGEKKVPGALREGYYDVVWLTGGLEIHCGGETYRYYDR